MLGTSLKALVFVRAASLALQYFAPLLVAALVLILVFDHDAKRLLLLLEVLAIGEVAFYVLVYIPQSRASQRPATHPPTLATREERRKVFLKAHAHVSDPETYLSKWFLRAPLHEIRRENVKEFFAWAFLNKSTWGLEDEEELEEYVDKLDELLGQKLPLGWGRAQALRVTLDPVIMKHRPLLWYLIIGFVDAYTYFYLTLTGFTFYRQPLSRILTVFPFRHVTLLSRRTTPSKTLTYFCTPHTSPSALPIVFIHGVGVGLWPYRGFLRELRQATGGSVGIMAVEVMPVSSRITGTFPDQKQVCADVAALLARHGWDRFVLATHSFGSTVAANMLHDPELAPRVASCLFIDPVTFLLHLPDVAYNFTRRPPRLPNEHIISYFAATDMLIAHTLSRRFFWAQNVLWKEDLGTRRTTVALGGRDVVAPSLAVGRYIADDRSAYERFLMAGDDAAGANTADGDDVDPEADRDAWQRRPWKGEGLDVVWYPRCDHAEMFDTRRDYMPLVDVLRSYSAQVD